MAKDPDESWGHQIGFVRKISPAGAALWTTDVGTDRTVTAVATDEDGNVYVDGHTYNGSTFVSKVSANGALLWDQPFVPQNPNAQPGRIAVDSAKAELLIAGSSDYDGYGILRRYSASGAWLSQLNMNGPLASEANINLDGTAVYVVQTSNTTASLIKQSTLQSPGWTKAIQPGAKVRVDEVGNVFVRSGSVRKYNPSGALLWEKQLATSGVDFDVNSVGNKLATSGSVSTSNGDTDAYVEWQSF